MVTKEGNTGRLYQQVAIDVLPDNVLLEIFELYLGKDDAIAIDYSDHNYDGWHTLVHVCRTWRCIVFASPRRLDLKLFCTPQRSVNSKALDIWPELPIVIVAGNTQFKDDATNAIAALKQHNRVCKITYRNGRFQDSFLKEFAAVDEPFLSLTSLHLSSLQLQNVTVLPNSFLGGSAPRLRSLSLEGIPYPSIGNLLSSTTNLVQLSLWRIPLSGYVAPETIVPCLSMLAKLESLEIGFKCPRSRAHQTSRHPPPLTRMAFHNLTFFGFSGDTEYLEDILSQIETPMLNQSYFSFFNRLVFDTPLLGHFIRRTETFMSIHTACIEFSKRAVEVTLLGRNEMDDYDREALRLEIPCKPLDWQLSAIAQVWHSFLSSFPTLESLDITVSHKDWQDEIEVTQWQEFLLPFTFVRDMSLGLEDSVRLVAPALQELAREKETEVLPVLQNLSIRVGRWQPSGPLKEAIEQFIAARQFYGHPVTVYY